MEVIFKLKNKRIKDKIIGDIRNLFRLKKESKTMKYKIIRDIKLLFEQEGNYYKPIRVGNF